MVVTNHSNPPLLMGMVKDYGGQCLMGFKGLRRRKQVDSESVNLNQNDQQLARRLNVVDLVGIGVGTTIGAGVYILIGSVAREQTGPALPIAFLIAGIAAALSAFCYAELSCRCPSAGSAYHYSYICIGEGVAWIIGWALILEYAIGGSVVARGVTPNLALFFGDNNLPTFLARHTVYGITIDPCAAALVIIATILLCIGIKESSLAQTIVTSINICALVFVIVAGGYLASKNGWVGYDLSNGYLPFGINGVLGGSATVFFSYIGFDTVTATAEEVRSAGSDLHVVEDAGRSRKFGEFFFYFCLEPISFPLYFMVSFFIKIKIKLVQQVKNPKKDLPWGVGISLSLSCILYMILSFVIVGLVPYNDLDKDTPISSAFSVYGVEWAAFVITTGAVMALLAALMGSLLPQSRILLAMARDGLLPSLFADINKHTQVPVKGTIATGILATALAFIMDVSELAGMVSVGTLLAFTAVAVSVLVIRYMPPNELHLLASAGESSSASGGHGHNMQGVGDEILKGPFTLSGEDFQGSVLKSDPYHGVFVDQETYTDSQKGQRRRKLAAWFLTIICIGVLLLTASASAENLPSPSRITLCGIGGVVFLAGTIGLAFIGQDGAAAVFGHTGGFSCPFVPYLPAACILLNTYLLINLGTDTWIRVSVWLLIGGLVYLFYGRTHSLLLNTAYVPITHTEDTNNT